MNVIEKTHSLGGWGTINWKWAMYQLPPQGTKAETHHKSTAISTNFKTSDDGLRRNPWLPNTSSFERNTTTDVPRAAQDENAKCYASVKRPKPARSNNTIAPTIQTSTPFVLQTDLRQNCQTRTGTFNSKRNNCPVNGYLLELYTLTQTYQQTPRNATHW